MRHPPPSLCRWEEVDSSGPPKGGLYTRNPFQGENIDLPVPSKTEEAKGGN